MIDLEGFYQLLLEAEKHRERRDCISEPQGEEGQWTQAETLCSCWLSPQQQKKSELPIRDMCKQRGPWRCPASLPPPQYAMPTVGIQE